MYLLIVNKNKLANSFPQTFTEPLIQTGELTDSPIYIPSQKTWQRKSR